MCFVQKNALYEQSVYTVQQNVQYTQLYCTYRVNHIIECTVHELFIGTDICTNISICTGTDICTSI